DLADKEEAELRIVQEYLPKPLAPEELDAAISAAIAETGASSPKDMGRVMQKLTTEYAGRVDGKSLSGLVRARLAS
ncbi:MAG: GatB/YqeY domain-containing protein, partial [Deltaproteobacteria bacterium]|nr:GatB/YqeY domain-containing protein [Deltaproteobacteria bacterium]